MEKLFQIPQLLPMQLLPYLASFSLILFLLSLPRFLNRKVKLIVSFLLTIGLTLTPLFPFIQSIVSFLGYSLTLVISVLLLITGLAIGKKKLYGTFGISRPSLSPLTREQKILRKLELDKARLLQQLQNVRGDLRKEREISLKLNYVNRQIKVLRAKLGLPI